MRDVFLGASNTVFVGQQFSKGALLLMKLIKDGLLKWNVERQGNHKKTQSKGSLHVNNPDV